METWSGFEFHRHVFEEREAFVACPNPGTANGHLLLKTEYWGAFPATEAALLAKGFHLCFVRNTNRWGTDDNLDRQARFVRHIQQEYGLCGKVVPVGMSCGGLIAIKFAAKYPELVECLYLDAPVVNYMSCPCGFGIGEVLGGGTAIPEILNALGLPDVAHLMAYREMPLDKLPALVAAKLPTILVAGDSDNTVPYVENGLLVKEAYEAAGVPITVYLKPGCDHHPHGLVEDLSPVVDFICRACGVE